MKDDLGGDCYALKRFEGGRVATIIPLTFGRARLCISNTDPVWYDDTW